VTVEVDPLWTASEDCRHPKAPPSHQRYRPRPSCAANSLLGVSENHSPAAPPFREPRLGIGLNNRKTIAVQCSLAEAIEAWQWFAGPITICWARYTTQIG